MTINSSNSPMTITYLAASTNVPRPRIMAAGECTAEVTVGKIKIPLDNIKISPREDTVTKSINLIDLYSIIHARGTPASGKTTLALLLRDRLKDQGRHVFYLPNWKKYLDKVDRDTWNALYEVISQRCPGPIPPNLPDRDVVMIVDEAQGSYKDAEFWNDIIKPISDNSSDYNLRIFLFCSYGSPLTGVDNKDFCNYYTPVEIPIQQRITLTPQLNRKSPQIGLFYTESEFNDVLSRMVRYMCPNLVATLDNEAKRYVFSLTNGHAGCVKAVIQFLCETYRAGMKLDETFVISKHHVVDTLDKNEESDFGFLRDFGVARAFLKEKDLKPDIRDILCEIAEEGNIMWEPERPGLEECYRRGWVHRMIAGDNRHPDSYDIAVLPSRLHEKWLQHLIGKDSKALPPRFTNLTQLCMEILPEFSRMNLKYSTTGQNLSTAAQFRPIEAQYQDEFYRAFNKVAGRGVPISTEWARTTSGRVDFFIPEKKWAVELLRDYNGVDDHIKRFKNGGQYFQWLETKAVNDWIVINCATTAPTAVYNESRLFHAVFQKDYTELQISIIKGRACMMFSV
ncbi:hypothetical protein BDV26DRAFT_291095 [Aspergillus bertholletiae]|uniref:Uncharacterized protein n=1 Tax=Aspergillus bertholletiae TaxID=1226010 RepID=A0A5N7BDA1_9EURO|nr:hypothetical protein BDV26DRAFT_291095 [Aspergillus bertholletiae]